MASVLGTSRASGGLSGQLKCKSKRRRRRRAKRKAKNEVGKGIQDVCTNSSYSKIYLWGEVSYVICQQLIVVDESNQTSKCSLLREKLAVEAPRQLLGQLSEDTVTQT
ncbi:hypothetical protein G4228_015079 [Cervus hanglu yarkandensis]|nr:hypothetical protein G4228_015079 [Cervus hanglu yarkandensis]